jgi:hypothetical protein
MATRLDALQHLGSALVGIEALVDGKPTPVGVARQADVTQSINTESIIGLGDIEIVEIVIHNIQENGLNIDIFRLRRRDLRAAGLVGYGAEILNQGELNVRIYDKGLKKTVLLCQGLVQVQYRAGFRVGSTSGENVNFRFAKLLSGAAAGNAPANAFKNSGLLGISQIDTLGQARGGNISQV